MFSSQREERVAAPHVITLVEFDMRKMRVPLLLAHEAIREQMQELEHWNIPWIIERNLRYLLKARAVTR